ncbi:TIP41-like family-domain-containing protein [Naematelia encephala]|uniref:TIP41-like family-domain-containing protein n=1 Tax=Naematelia encephala TaxID=71784 RepID=A0A1Y2AG29_9TREE|nr:TIP41-like family-domain-containing protein [Naematelia encephala]
MLMATTLPTPAPARIQATPPTYSLENKRYVKSIRIGDWSIESTKRPILNSDEIDMNEKSLNLPLPEMTFGNNGLSVNYEPHASSKLELKFDTIDALAGVAVGEGWEERVGGGVKVSMAEAWGKSRTSPSVLLSDTPLPSKPVKPHDWTYSTCYSGSIAGPSSSRWQESSTAQIPMKLLARQDPVLDQILFYDDVPLFEDELHDNGDTKMNVRIRVMPHCFFILMRLFVRVDGVLFRIHDVRIYHAFGSGEVIREVNGMEMDYSSVKAHLEKQSDLTPLTDQNFVYQVMMANASKDSKNTSTRVTGKPWPGLGRRVEVMMLPAANEVDAAGSGLRDLSL